MIATHVARPEITPARCQQLLDELVELYELQRFSCAVHGEHETFQVSSPRQRGDTQPPSLPVGCLAKLYTARIAADVFAQRGISLDAPLISLYPQFKVASDQATATISLRHLLTHTSGLDAEGLTGIITGELDLWSGASEIGQLFAPGDERSYCSLGFMLAGRIVELISGRSWWDHLARVTGDVTRRLPIESTGCRSTIHALGALPPRETTVAPHATAAFGHGLALPVDELARFGAAALGGQARAADLFAWWPDEQSGFCAAGTADVGETSEVDSRLQLLPSARLSIAAVAEGPLSAAVHDFFRQLIGSRWDGFVQPRTRVEPAVLLRYVLGRRFCCAVVEISFRRQGADVVADIRVGREGQSSWAGRTRVFGSVVVRVAQAGYLSGVFSAENVSFEFVLEPLDCTEGIRYLIFNRKMLLRNSDEPRGSP